MIKEFRIGNRTNNGTVIEIHPEFITCAGHYNISGMTSFKNNEINPEPLTEEWLEKLGCKKAHKRLYPKSPHLIGYCVGDPLNVFKELSDSKENFVFFGWDTEKKCVWIHITSSIIDTDIKFVHQLQNLIFILTGKELIYTS